MSFGLIVMRTVSSRKPLNFLSSRSYFNASVYFISEFFNPLQLHMIAVTEGLRFCHDVGHFPSYASTIIASTMILRSALAGPLYTFTEKNQALVTSVYYHSALEAQNLRYSIRQKDGKVDDKLRRSMLQRYFSQKCRELGCHPLKSGLYGMIQLPIWLTATFGLRNACGLQLTPFVYWPPMIPEFVTEGLVSPTTSLFLLTSTVLVTALNVEIGHLRRVYELTVTRAMASDPESVTKNVIKALVPARLPWQMKLSHGFGLCGILLVAIFSSFVPSALVIFWCTSSSHQLLLHLIHLSNRIRCLLGIKKTHVNAKRPYLALWLVAKSHYRILRWITNRV